MKIAAFASVFLLSLSSMAIDIVAGEPAYGGNGCPAGTLSSSVDPSTSEIRLYFDSFTARSGSSTGKRVDRKTCAITVPIQVPDGYQVAISNKIYGYAFARSGSVATYNQEIFTPGPEGARYSKAFRGSTNSSFVLDPGSTSEIFWTPCSASTNLRANMTFMTQGEAYANVDRVRFRVLKYRRCSN